MQNTIDELSDAVSSVIIKDMSAYNRAYYLRNRDRILESRRVQHKIVYDELKKQMAKCHICRCQVHPNYWKQHLKTAKHMRGPVRKEYPISQPIILSGEVIDHDSLYTS